MRDIGSAHDGKTPGQVAQITLMHLLNQLMHARASDHQCKKDMCTGVTADDTNAVMQRWRRLCPKLTPLIKAE